MTATARKTATPALVPGVVADVPLDLISPDMQQPRKDFDSAFLEELANDIKHRGVLQPIVVRENPDKPGCFLIRYGENRWRASQIAGMATIPAILSAADESSELDRLIDQVAENHLRRELNPVEMAEMLLRVRRELGGKLDEVAAFLEKRGLRLSRSYISNLIRLLDLPEWALKMIREGYLTAAHGKHLLPALASDEVLKGVQESLLESLNEGDRPSVADLSSTVSSLFVKHHARIDVPWCGIDYKKDCAGCRKQKKISMDGDSVVFCLDRECLDDKREQASEGHFQTSDSGVVDDNPGSPGPAPSSARVGYSQDPDAGDEPGAVEIWHDSVARYDVMKWARDEVSKQIKDKQGVTDRLLFLSSVFPEDFYYIEEPILRLLEEHGVDVLDSEGAIDAKAFLTADFPGAFFADLGPVLVESAEGGALKALIELFGVDPDSWRPSASFLASFDPEDLARILVEFGLVSSDMADSLLESDEDALVEKALSFQDRLPRPESFIRYWDLLFAQ